MRRNSGIALSVAVAACTLASAAIAGPFGNDQANSTMIGGSGGAANTSMADPETTVPRGEPCCNGAQVTGTRYETSLMVLKAQMDYRAWLDGGHLTAKHEAEFQQALDDTNRHFHKGPYARQ